MKRYLAVLGGVILAVACLVAVQSQSPRAAHAQQSEWYMDPQRPQHAHVAQHPELRIFTDTPTFAWFGTWAGPDRLKAYIDRALAAGAVPQVVLMNAEARECTDFAEARRWIEGAARAIGNRRVMVALEPDSLGTLHLIPRARREACHELIRYEIKLLGALSNAEVYMEAKSSRWDRPRETARQLNRVRVCRVGGVMANATHMHWTNENLRYLRRLDKLITGCRLRRLVNTSHNGQGPAGHWCDRRWRAGAGPRPRRLSGMEALGYVNRPYAQSCWNGRVAFRLDYALNMARRYSENFDRRRQDCRQKLFDISGHQADGDFHAPRDRASMDSHSSSARARTGSTRSDLGEGAERLANRQSDCREKQRPREDLPGPLA